MLSTDPTSGAPACRSVVDGTDPNCVPYNLFTIGGVTPEALDYLQVPGIAAGHDRTGDLHAFGDG